MIFDPSLPSSAGKPTKVAKLTRRLLAPNAGAFTFSGTCSYIIGEGEVAIIDPGPAIPAHIDALMNAVRGEKLVGILVTHSHRDHSPAARALRAITGAPVLGCAPYAPPKDIAIRGPGLDASHDPDYAPDRALKDGESLALGGATIQAVATPGHTANHLCYALDHAAIGRNRPIAENVIDSKGVERAYGEKPASTFSQRALGEERALFTGDHVMGWATTVVAPPDGSMADYMASLEKLRARDDLVYWPAHGAAIDQPQRYLRGLMAHRRGREVAILQ
ncbi:MAG TPA: MBL fold metallo-hydrolase, partial [Methylocystis sp.]|nr:MBL fold metallo-hydrolase [Methylocystis sp.]